VRLPTRYLTPSAPTEAPRISIVTPSHNHGSFLEATIRSVLDQDYPSLEYVVQDGGSSDESRTILERYSHRLHRWESAPDDGQSWALNHGFAQSSGEIMAYLNADDVLLPGSLSYVARYLQLNPAVDVVYGHRILIDGAGREIGRQIVPPHDDTVLSWGDFVPQETLFWRRSAWEAAGARFDESFECAMDWDLLVRLRDAGARMVRLPRFLGAYRVHGNQKTLVLGETTGKAEMQRIRARVHGRAVSHDEALRHVRGYLLRHVALDQLYRLGLLRY